LRTHLEQVGVLAPDATYCFRYFQKRIEHRGWRKVFFPILLEESGAGRRQGFLAQDPEMSSRIRTLGNTLQEDHASFGLDQVFPALRKAASTSQREDSGVIPGSWSLEKR
jgi:hypothetical protein